MPVSPFEIIVGPADVWVAAVGTAFPAVSASPAADWKSLGKTDGAVSVSHAQTQAKIRVDQKTPPLKIVRTEEDITVSFGLAEITLETYARILNNATVTPDAGPPAIKSFPLHQGVDVAQFAMLIRGGSPYMNANMQYQLPKVSQSGAPGITFSKGDKAVLSTEWAVLYDSTQSASFELGKLVAQTA